MTQRRPFPCCGEGMSTSARQFQTHPIMGGTLPIIHRHDDVHIGKIELDSMLLVNPCAMVCTLGRRADASWQNVDSEAFHFRPGHSHKTLSLHGTFGGPRPQGFMHNVENIRWKREGVVSKGRIWANGANPDPLRITPLRLGCSPLPLNATKAEDA